MTNQITSGLERQIGPFSGPYLDIRPDRDQVPKSGLQRKQCLPSTESFCWQIWWCCHSCSITGRRMEEAAWWHQDVPVWPSQLKRCWSPPGQLQYQPTWSGGLVLRLTWRLSTSFKRGSTSFPSSSHSTCPHCFSLFAFKVNVSSRKLGGGGESQNFGVFPTKNIFFRIACLCYE